MKIEDLLGFKLCSQRGSYIVVHDNRQYILSKRVNYTFYFKCKTVDCQGTLKVEYDNGNVNFQNGTIAHTNCAGLASVIIKDKAIGYLVEYIRRHTSESIKYYYHELIVLLDKENGPEFVASFPKFDSLSPTLHRKRKVVGGSSPNKMVDLVEFPEVFDTS